MIGTDRILNQMDTWRQQIPEETYVICPECGEYVYDTEFGAFCSKECVITNQGLEIIQDEKYCAKCGEALSGWDGYLTDNDGNYFCDIDCYLKYSGIK